eukprot:SAG22_NODE_548_length_9247_cov_14.468080_2_plen_119_part_00
MAPSALTALLSAAAAATSAAAAATTQATTRDAIPNMNGKYAATVCHGKVCEPSTFPTNYMSYPGGVESFDAYHGPITSTYSMVWWTGWSNPLPKDIVDRFEGKTMGASTLGEALCVCI